METTGTGTSARKTNEPWVTLLHRSSIQQRIDAREDEVPQDCDIDPAEYSDGGLQEKWIRNLNAVDVKVKLTPEARTYSTVARIDSMSGGCFISQDLCRKLGARVDPSSKHDYQLPRGVLTTVGTVPLLVYWRNEHKTWKGATVKFNVPLDWELDDIDMLVTVPMAQELGFDKVARGMPREQILAANFRRCGGIFFRKQNKQEKAEAEKASIAKAKENSAVEAELKRKHRAMRLAPQPRVAVDTEIAV